MSVHSAFQWFYHMQMKNPIDDHSWGYFTILNEACLCVVLLPGIITIIIITITIYLHFLSWTINYNPQTFKPRKRINCWYKIKLFTLGKTNSNNFMIRMNQCSYHFFVAPQNVKCFLPNSSVRDRATISVNESYFLPFFKWNRKTSNCIII